MSYKDPERQKAYNKAYREADPEDNKARCKAWYKANAEHCKASVKAWQKANPESVKAYKKTWSNTHPESRRNTTMNYQARKKGSFVEDVDRVIVFERDDGICYLCNLPVDPDNWHIEHVIPLIAGGEHSYANTGVSHPVCNWKKGARAPDPVVG